MQLNGLRMNSITMPLVQENDKNVATAPMNQTKSSQTSSATILAYAPVSSPKAQEYNKQVASSMVSSYLKTRLNQVNKVQETTTAPVAWKNDLRSMFQDNKVVLNAIIMRTFNAKDTNGNELIDKGEEHGTFRNAAERLDELKGYGVNTLHLLPLHEPGKTGAFGTAGSLYSPKDYLSFDPALGTKEDFKYFANEAHKRGIRLMIDLPSCGSLDLYKARPDLMAIDGRGLPETPQGWQDIRMFDPFENKDTRTLNKALIDYHKQFVDLCLECGIDGIRADVARAKPVEFWDEIIPYARAKDPQFAFLAETYTYEDASPMLNMPQDRPEELLKVGFDSYYGQYHIFPSWHKAKDLHNYVKENIELTQRLPKGKSLIGSFATHDDKSPMSNGGVPYCNLTTGIQFTLPMTNPYFVTGFESGDRYLYSYKDKEAKESMTDSHQYIVHPEMVDIFNMSRKPAGNHPEIGKFMGRMAEVRKQYEDVITKGSYIPLETTNKDDKIIAYARHYNGKTLLIVANKDVNLKEVGTIKIPGLQQNQELKDLTLSYGTPSKYSAINGALNVDLGPARVHVFEINTPDIEKQSSTILKQNL